MQVGTGARGYSSVAGAARWGGCLATSWGGARRQVGGRLWNVLPTSLHGILQAVEWTPLSKPTALTKATGRRPWGLRIAP